MILEYVHRMNKEVFTKRTNIFRCAGKLKAVLIRMSDSDEGELFGFSEVEIPARKNLVNVCLGLLQEAEDEEVMSWRIEASGEERGQLQTQKGQDKFPLGAFQMWLQEEGKASITSANPGILLTVVAKLAGIAYDALTADKKIYWEGKSRVALIAYKQSRAFNQKSTKDKIENSSQEGGEVHNPEDESVKKAKNPRVRKIPL